MWGLVIASAPVARLLIDTIPYQALFMEAGTLARKAICRWDGNVSQINDQICIS